MGSFVSTRISEAQVEHCQMIELIEGYNVEGLILLVAQHNHRAKEEAYQKLLKNQMVL